MNISIIMGFHFSARQSSVICIPHGFALWSMSTTTATATDLSWERWPNGSGLVVVGSIGTWNQMWKVRLDDECIHPPPASGKHQCSGFLRWQWYEEEKRALLVLLNLTQKRGIESMVPRPTNCTYPLRCTSWWLSFVAKSIDGSCSFRRVFFSFSERVRLHFAYMSTKV